MSASTRNSLRKVCRFQDEDDFIDNDPAQVNRRSSLSASSGRTRERKWMNNENNNANHGGTTFGGANRTTSAQKHNRPTNMESDILNDLNNSKSELARFLFVKTNTHEKDGSWLKSVRNLASTLTTGNEEEEEEREQFKSINHLHSFFYNLALEPIEVRSERIIMLAES